MPQASENQLMNQAQAFLEARQWAKAERTLRKLLKHRPGNQQVILQLGTTYLRLGQASKAADAFKKAVSLFPGDGVPLIHLAEALYEQGRFNEASSTAAEAINLSPEDPGVRRRRATLLMRLGDAHGACSDLQAAHELNPGDLEILGALVDGIIARGHVPMETEPALLLVDRQPVEARNQARLGTVHRLNGQHDEAIGAYEKALQIDRFNSDARAGKAEILISRKQFEEAAELLRPLVNAPTCSILPMQAWMRACKGLDRHEDAITAAERWLASDRRSPSHQSSLCHRLAQSYDLLDQRDEAFNAWTRANAIDSRRWDADEHERTTGRIITAFDNTAIESLPRSSSTSRKPVFILGMFRSGTSLVEQILASHPDMYGAGELPAMLDLAGTLQERTGSDLPYPECIESTTPELLDDMASHYLESLGSNAGSAQRISDKLPMNFLNIGLIGMVLPNAKIIHCTRDPLDTCFSCWGNPFSARSAFTANLESLGRAYLDYLRIMDHWCKVSPLPIHSVVYEELVHEPEPIVRGLLEFLELDWDPACLDFHDTKRVTRTLSVDQVNKPLTTSSVHRSRRYWNHLEQLRTILGPLVPDIPEG